ncbi:MAG: hypothetical protein ACN6P0_25920, partial [Pseudomonas capeferrum]|uniref:hypothetical protein n=1 Tax=Pseudomonas capeferrum TaxID=1495066 RepID=UPI003D0960DD
TATILALFVAVAVGFTWRNQVRAKNQHDVASRMLVQLYKFDSVFCSSRVRGIYSNEVKFDPAEESWDDHNFRRLQLGLERRIDKLDELAAEISAIVFEASMLKDFDVSGPVVALNELRGEYAEYARLTILCSDPRSSADERLDFVNEKAMRRDVFVDVDFLGRISSASKSDFGTDLELAVRNLEIELKKKLI